MKSLYKKGTWVLIALLVLSLLGLGAASADECTHEHVLEEEDERHFSRAISYDDTYHQVISGYEVVLVRRCGDCDQYLGETFLREEEIGCYFESHELDFDEDTGRWECWRCDYVGVCSHPEGKRYTRMEREDGVTESLGYEPVDGSSHREIYKNALQYTLCGLCNTVLEEKIVERVKDDYQEEHNFNSSGKCEDCGYVLDCAHKHLVETSGSWMDVYTPENESLHFRTQECYWFDDEDGESVCLDCGNIIRNGKVVMRAAPDESTEVRYYESHTFENGVCTKCGYRQAVIPAETKTPAPQETPTANPTAAPTPDATPVTTPTPQETPLDETLAPTAGTTERPSTDATQAPSTDATEQPSADEAEAPSADATASPVPAASDGSNSSGGNKIPKMGDSSRAELWLCLMAVAMLVLVARHIFEQRGRAR